MSLTTMEQREEHAEVLANLSSALSTVEAQLNDIVKDVHVGATVRIALEVQRDRIKVAVDTAWEKFNNG